MRPGSRLTTTAADRVRADLAELAQRGFDPSEFAVRTSSILARALAFDGLCMLTMDPASGIATSAYIENGLSGPEADRIAEIEYAETDVNKFGALAESGRLAASLSAATDGKLERSRRHRELRAPNGLGDELRAVLVSDSVSWGGLTLGRSADREPFAYDEVELMASVSAHLANGLRRAVLLTSLWTDDDQCGAGLLLLTPDNSITRADTSAETWLAELRDTGPNQDLPPVVIGVASRARSLADQRDATGVTTSARVRTASGSWLTVRASVLSPKEDPMTAVILEPTDPLQLAPLIADGYELTGRERAISELVVQGLTTEAIAGSLYISAWTVQDHLKSVFEKVGVSSRGELVSRLYFERSGPRLRADDQREPTCASAADTRILGSTGRAHRGSLPRCRIVDVR